VGRIPWLDRKRARWYYRGETKSAYAGIEAQKRAGERKQIRGGNGIKGD